MTDKCKLFARARVKEKKDEGVKERGHDGTKMKRWEIQTIKPFKQPQPFAEFAGWEFSAKNNQPAANGCTWSC